MIRKGTTPIHIFKLPFPTSELSAAKATYRQGEKIILEKRLEDAVLNESAIAWKLTQGETFKFLDSKPVEIQLRVLTFEDKAHSTKIITESVYRSLDEEILQPVYKEDE